MFGLRQWHAFAPKAFHYSVRINDTPRLHPPTGGRIHPSQEGNFQITHFTRVSLEKNLIVEHAFLFQTKPNPL